MEQKTYPTIRFVLRHGQMVAVLTGLGVAALGLWAAYGASSWVWGLAAIAGAALAYLVLRAFAELVDVVADTLLPPE